MLTRLSLFLFTLLLFISAGAAKPAAAPELHVLIWSDYIDPELVKDFQAKTGATVKLDVYEETEAMLAKLQQAGGEASYDLVVASDHSVPVLAKLGLIKKIDPAKVPNAKNIDPRFVKPPYDPKGDWSLPYQWGTVGVIYNKKKLPNFKHSWSEFFSGNAASKFVMLDSPRDTLGAALRFKGHGVNSRKPAEVQEAGKLVLTAKKDANCVGFDGSVGAAKKVIAGQADFAMVYNGDALNAIKEAPADTFDFLVPDEGSIIWVDTMLLTASGKNSDLAATFMDFILDARNGARLSNYINYATPNAAALPDIIEESRKNIRIYPSDAQLKTLEYLEDVGDATRLYDAVWTAVKAR